MSIWKRLLVSTLVGVVMENPGAGKGKDFRLTWFGVAFWGSQHTFVGIGIIIFNIAIDIFLVDGPFLVWLIMAGYWLGSAYIIGILMNEATPVALDTDGLWIKVFFRPKFIPWEDIRELYYQPLANHVIIVRYLSPVHYFVGDFFRQSFLLVPGLDHREELFWEIHHRACEVQGRDVPVKDWKRKRFR